MCGCSTLICRFQCRLGLNHRYLTAFTLKNFKTIKPANAHSFSNTSQQMNDGEGRGCLTFSPLAIFLFAPAERNHTGTVSLPYTWGSCLGKGILFSMVAYNRWKQAMRTLKQQHQNWSKVNHQGSTEQKSSIQDGTELSSNPKASRGPTIMQGGGKDPWA